MKLVITILLLFFVAAYFASCNGDGKTKIKKDKVNESFRTAGVYVDFAKKAVQYGIVGIVRKEISIAQLKDSVFEDGVWKKRWLEASAIDTTFWMQATRKDSTGKDTSFWYQIPFESVSLNRDVDSGAAILSRWIVTHPQFFAKDTTKAVKSVVDRDVRH